MTSSGDLQFDKMVVDTELAQEYMKQNNYEFHSIGFKDSGETSCDQANNKIYFGGDINDCIGFLDGTKTSFQLYQLAEKIENNVDLFCQLEFLIRQIPIETTLRELKMIVNYLRYYGPLHTHSIQFKNYKRISMTNNSSLIDLGCVAALAPAVMILAEENTAVVCRLFTVLCGDCGLDLVTVYFLKHECYDIELEHNITGNKVLEGGCMGVVAAQGDVESAVNVFLSAPKGVLWGLRRILVQESACERFKREFAWKTRCASQADVDPKLKSLCTDMYMHEGKVFLGEYVGSDTDVRNVVLIESFRTVKELLTLIAGYQPFCVSLWSHGVAESNEIAFGITAPMVWVNGYGTVGDHLQVPLAYYSHMNFEDKPEIYKVQKLQKKWMKLTLSDRRQKVMAVFEKLPEEDVYTFYKQYIISTQNDYGNFAQVGSSELVIGVCKPREVYEVCCDGSSLEVRDILQLLVLGSGFVISSAKDEVWKKCLTALERAKLPIMMAEYLYAADCFPLVQYTRVIHTSIGTIFAN